MFSSKNKHRKMQDPLSFTFCWGETFDTVPHSTQRSDENGRTHRSAPTKGYSSRINIATGLLSRSICATYEFQKQFPFWNFLVPTEELFSSNGGTFQFQRRNFLVPALELLGGRALGRGLRVSKWE